jgi:hypothetical protein
VGAVFGDDLRGCLHYALNLDFSGGEHRKY